MIVHLTLCAICQGSTVLKVGFVVICHSRAFSPFQATPGARTCRILSTSSSEVCIECRSYGVFVLWSSPHPSIAVKSCHARCCFCHRQDMHVLGATPLQRPPIRCFMFMTVHVVMAVYGATSLPLPTFLAGMFVGSLKPYLLDSCECGLAHLWSCLRRFLSFFVSMLMTGRRTVEACSVPATAVACDEMSFLFCAFLVRAHVAILFCVWSTGRRLFLVSRLCVRLRASISTIPLFFFSSAWSFCP